MWNERTRPADGPQKCRLRMCRLMDRKASEPVGAVSTPDGDKIPYAQPLDRPGKQDFTGNGSIKIMGRANGSVVNSCRGGEVQTCEAVYDHFSDDGKTFYQGRLSVTSPASMFAPGRTELEADLTVSGEHQGEMKLHAVFERKTADAPAMLSFRTGEDGLPESRGYSSYDGVTLRVEDMES